jgi:class 3 adenylate cyclase/tetratricopeptide (TPR) repeat protein
MEAGSRFCRWCGAPVAEGATRTIVPDRRFATILFADIVDSTVMVRGLEPEHALERLSPIVEAMKQTVIEHGGTICRDQGDGIMASFGAPVSDDRHAANACLAAMALLDRTGASVPFSLSCRVGIHSGLVVGHMTATSSGSSYSVSGEAVHLAARLEAAARVGTVLVSDATRQLIEGQFAVREVKLADLKGFNREVIAFELERPLRHGWTRERSRHAGLAFCGRKAEIERLVTAYGDPAIHGAVVSGDPAMGKSRLAHEFIDVSVPRHAPLDMIVCAQNLSRTPYGALRPLLLSLLALPVDSGKDQVELGLSAWLRSAGMPVDETALRFLLGLDHADRSWSELEARARRRRVATALTGLLSHQADKDARSVLLIEDVHWADSASTAVLSEMMKSLDGERFFFVLTTRSKDCADLVGSLSCIHLALGPLDKEACETILNGLLGRSPTLLRLKGRLLELAGGTPLFLQQLVQWLVDSRALVGNVGNYRLAVHADQLDLPSSLHAVTLWRVDRLPSQARHVLGIAAVLQDAATSDAIVYASGLAPASVQAELDLLIEHGLLMRHSGTGDAAFAFRHALLRESVYESLVQERRAELHGMALRYLEEATAAEHFHREGLMSGHAYTSGNWKAAAKYARIVSERAIAASAYREAAGHLEHAIDALYRLPRDHDTLQAAIDVRLQARICYSAMAKHDLCLAHIARAEEIAREIGDKGRLLACSIYRVGVLNFTGPIAEALVIAAKALRQAEAAASVPHIAIAGLALGQAHYASGNFREAIAALSTGARELTGEKMLMRPGTTGTAAAMCASLQGAAHAFLGEFSDAALCLARADGITRQTGRPYDTILHAYADGITNTMQGHVDGAICAFERALEACRINDIETFVTTVAGQLGLAYIQAGRVDEAVALMEPALEEALLLKNLPQIATLKRQLGLAALRQDEVARAQRFARDAADTASRGGYRMIHVGCLHLQAMVDLQRGGEDLEAGLRAIARALEIAEALGVAPTLPALRATEADLLHATGRMARQPGGMRSSLKG